MNKAAAIEYIALQWTYFLKFFLGVCLEIELLSQIGIHNTIRTANGCSEEVITLNPPTGV